MRARFSQRVDRVVYFAYGSNMKTSHLRKTVPSASAIGPARLSGKQLVFNKKSVDGSGKANLADRSGGVVWGVLYELDPVHFPALDKVEGGYDRREFEVTSEGEEPITAQSYVSRKLTQDPRSYEWYKRLVVAGAREH